MCPYGRVLFINVPEVDINTILNRNSNSDDSSKKNRELSISEATGQPHPTESCAFDLVNSNWIVEPFKADNLKINKLGGVMNCRVIGTSDKGISYTTKTNLNYYTYENKYIVLEWNETNDLLRKGEDLECTTITKSYGDFASRVIVSFNSSGVATLEKKYHHLLSLNKYIDSNYTFGCIVNDGDTEMKIYTAKSEGFTEKCDEGTIDQRCDKICKSDEIGICKISKSDKDQYECTCVANQC